MPRVTLVSRATVPCALLVALAGAFMATPLHAQRVHERNPTARCGDGTFYYGRPVRGVSCEGHRGVTEWLVQPRATTHHSSAPRSGAAARRAARTPKGATARCHDGSYAFQRTRARACVGHGGIARWLRRP
jgi:Protein of unknown function (DUF3761)